MFVSGVNHHDPNPLHNGCYHVFKDNTFEPPKHWDIMDDEENYRDVVLKSASHEYQDVMKKFNASVGSPRRIQEV